MNPLFENEMPSVLVIPWVFVQPDHPGLTLLEQAFQYGVSKKIELFTGKLSVARHFSRDLEWLKGEEQLSESTLGKHLVTLGIRQDERFILTGSLENLQPIRPKKYLGTMGFRLRLYDVQGQLWLLDTRYALTNLQLDPSQADIREFKVPMKQLNDWMNWAAGQVLMALDTEHTSQSVPRLCYHQFCETWEGYTTLVKAEFMEGSQADRLACYQTMLEQDPSIEMAHVALAKLYKSTKNFNKAVEHYRKAAEVSKCTPKTKASYITEIGVCCAILGIKDKAMLWWKKAIEMAPDFLTPYMNTALALEEEGRMDEAERYFRHAQRLAPNDFRTAFNLARIYSLSNRWDAALEQYLYQVALDPHDPWAHCNVANSYLQLGETDKAIPYFETTLAEDPEGEAGQFAKLILTTLKPDLGLATPELS